MVKEVLTIRYYGNSFFFFRVYIFIFGGFLVEIDEQNLTERSEVKFCESISLSISPNVFLSKRQLVDSRGFFGE